LEAYRLRASTSVVDLLRGLHPDLKRKVRAALGLIRSELEAGKLLKDELVGLRSLRVGRFRIIYRVGPRHTIDLVAVGPRHSIYAETLRLLRRRPR
jgi:mRNA interferase RelE/StbE